MGKPSGKHLDLSKRQVINNCLENKATAKDIASLVNLNPTSISREIKKRRVLKRGNIDDTSICTDCANKKNCYIKGNCSNKACKKKCVRCKTMHYCNHKTIFKCKKNIFNHFPFVCNGCEERNICPLDKYMYYPNPADINYRKILSESRRGN